MWKSVNGIALFRLDIKYTDSYRRNEAAGENYINEFKAITDHLNTDRIEVYTKKEL